MEQPPSPAPAVPRWRALLQAPGTLISARALSAIVVALVLDLLSESLWAGAAATLLQAGVCAWLGFDFLRRKPWRVARIRALIVEGLTLAVALLFVAARIQILLGALLGTIQPLVAAEILRSYGAVVLIACSASLWERRSDRLAILSRLELRPVQTVVLSFGLTILAGTLLLSLPMSVSSLERVSVLDAFFVATSAVCITGLSVVDVATTYSRFGHWVLLVLIQAGGLGIMFLFAAFAVLSSRRVSARKEHELGEAAGADASKGVRRTLWFILLMTLGFELVGALLLLPAMLEADPANGVFHALFHAVSAFCNSGFSTLPRGIADAGPWTTAVIGGLVVIGGLGAPVIGPLLLRARGRLRTLPLHAKLALWTSAVLLVVGFTGILLLESPHALRDQPLLSRLGHALFLSVSARTAGFDLLGMGVVSPAGAAWLMGLMLIGANPGSTGGGLKTTTFAVLCLSLVAVLRRRDEVTMLGRTVPQEDVLRAVAILWSGLIILGGAILALLVTETIPPLSLAFEAFSAFSTTGFNGGITQELSAPGRLIIVGLMFVGRLGPLALLAAFFDRRSRARVRYPSERVQFG